MDNLDKAIKYYKTAKIKNIHISGSEVINMPALLEEVRRKLEKCNAQSKRNNHER